MPNLLQVSLLLFLYFIRELINADWSTIWWQIVQKSCPSPVSGDESTGIKHSQSKSKHDIIGPLFVSYIQMDSCLI